jgi:dienelactone hydrolase
VAASAAGGSAAALVGAVLGGVMVCRRSRSRPRWRTILALAALLAGSIGGLSGSGSPAAATVAAITAAPREPGPYVAGTMTISLAGTKVVIWYPADPRSARGHGRYSYDVRSWLPPSVARRVTPGEFTYTTEAYEGIVPSRSGPFPLVLFAHGLYSFPDQSTFLTAWLATQGYVVAAPALPIHDLASYYDYLGEARPTSPSDEEVLADTEDRLRRLSAEADGPWSGLIGTGKIGIIGHSQGGIDAMQFALRPDVGTYVAMAAGFLGAHPALAPIPSLFLAGGADQDILASWVRAVYATALPPKRLVVLGQAGHLAFTDLCLVGAGHGGLAALGRQIGGRLPVGAPFTGRALNGCGRGYLAPERGFAEIRSLVLADLRRALG